MRLLRTFLRTALVVAQVALLAGALWFFLESRAPRPAAGGPVLFGVEKGRTVRAVAGDLKARGLLRRTTPFVVLYELFYRPRSLKAGEYQVPSGASAREVLEVLARGRVFLHPVTVAEGLTGAETFEVFLAAGFGTRESYAAAFADPSDLALLDSKAPDLEGYLFPETYRLPKGSTAEEVLPLMTAQFKDVFGPAWRTRAAELGMSVRDVVVLASLIEEETARPEEKPLVSAVFHNRLRLGMKLDCDPTIIYALKKAGPFDGRLRSKDLKFESPYNTYLHRGLPPGPICNPGRASLEAALHPASADFLYFVAKGDGGHFFSRTFREHQEAVRKFRR
jgi:UPF0755 protein